MHLSIKLIISLIFIFEWVVRLIALYVVPRNRKPSSATAWLMLIMTFPTIGLVAFILIGSPKLSGRRRSKQRTMDYIIQKAVEEARSDAELRKFVHLEVTDRIDHMVKLTNNLGGMPAFSSNKVDLIPGYDETFSSIAADIALAKDFVHIEFFITVLDPSTQAIFDAMEAAVKRGVKVRVLFDAFASRRYPGYRKMKKTLTAIGVEWYAMLPLRLPGKSFNRPDLRNHRKIVVVDAKVGYTGSQNIVTRNYHRRDALYYDELMAKVEGPVVTQLHAVFITDWYSECGELLTRDNRPEIKLELHAKGSALAQVMPSGPGYDNDNNLKLFTTLIHEADERIIIVNPYFVPDDSLMIAITSAAQRGVEVIMLNSEIMDQRMVGHAQRSYYEELLKSGVQIYLYNSPILLHSKYMLIDNDMIALGSSNLDIRSFQLDLEVTLLIYDRHVAAQLATITDGYMRKAHPVKLTEWHARPLRDKFFDSIARLTAALQ
jgi:cardiolipin synthase